MSDEKSEMSKLASRAGKARAAKMTPEERSASAKLAAESRWAGVPRATHAGILHIGDVEIPCFVLSNGTRVISQSGMSKGLGISKGGDRSAAGDRIGNLLATQSISLSVSEELTTVTRSPLRFRLPQGGAIGNGYVATALADVCDAILDAKAAGRLKANQEKLAARALVLTRAFARVGVIALVDEATGYQYDRAKDELQKILKGYISEELRPWVSRFSNEFFRQAYRLHGWEFTESSNKRPQYMGKFINQVVYEQLPEPVLPELRRVNPPDEKGRRKHRHHQYLTESTGVPHLDRQITAVTTLMKVSSDKPQFLDLFARAFPRKGKTLPLELSYPKAKTRPESDSDG